MTENDLEFKGLLEKKFLVEQKLKELFIKTEMITDSRKIINFTNNRHKIKFFSEWAKYSIENNDVVKDEFYELMRIGFKQFKVTKSTNDNELLAIQDRVKQFKELIDSCDSLTVKAVFGLKKNDVHRYVIALLLGLSKLITKEDDDRLKEVLG